jgi:hypothetical protein
MNGAMQAEVAPEATKLMEKSASAVDAGSQKMRCPQR